MCKIIEETNISVAWAKAYLGAGARGIKPLVVVINGFDDNNNPYEDMQIRRLLDQELLNENRPSIHTVANTIFPVNLWNPNENRSELYSRFLGIWPAVKRFNPLGHYFHRLIAYDDNTAEGFNQLENIIRLWSVSRPGIRPMRQFLQASTLVPYADLLTSDISHNFPCLQQISVEYESNDRDSLQLTAYYPKQILFKKGYGNYLGLCRLGKFIAHECGRLSLTRVTCIVGFAENDYTNAQFKNKIRLKIEQLED